MAVILALAALALAPSRLPPVDQCSSDPSFARFTAELAHAIRQKDAKALLGIVADDVTVDFDGSRGRRAFARVWQLDGERARRSRIWRELATVMRLGCARSGGGRLMPALGAQLDSADPLENLVALPGARLRKSPRSGSPVVQRLNFHVMTLEGDWPIGDWVHVQLSDGRSGYLLKSELRTALDWRAEFRMIEGRWRLMSFVEGD